MERCSRAEALLEVDGEVLEHRVPGIQHLRHLAGVVFDGG
jgi:hypothetical protein